ncbi:MAG: PspC domain-containing protein [Aggregatilineales bacterium]
MVRNFRDRIFGGVCGGLARITPFSSTVWRLLFVILTGITGITGLLVYTVCWWLLPADTLLERPRSNPLRFLLALVLSIALIAGWVLRADIALENGENLYLPLALLGMVALFFLKQLFSGKSNRHNLLPTLLTLIAGGVFIAGLADMIPAGLFDTLLRAAPALLIFAGLTIFLRHRLPYGGVLALLISAIFAGGLAFVAFDSRTDNFIDQNTITIEEPVEAVDAFLLQINVDVLDTEVQFITAPPGDNTIRAVYRGSNEAVLTGDYNEIDDSRASFTLTEGRSSPYPSLDAVGRGTLQIELPQGVPLDVAFEGDNGDVIFDMQALDLERLNVVLRSGDVLFTLPDYQPRSPGVEDNPGRLILGTGDLQILLNDEITAGRFVLPRNENPEPAARNYDSSRYAVEIAGDNWVLIARDYEDYEIQVGYVLSVPRGTVQLEQRN